MYLAPGDCFLRLASPEDELRSGDLSLSCSLVEPLDKAIEPSESDCKCVPFFGGRPSRLPEAVRFGPLPDFESSFDLKNTVIQ